MRKRNNLGILIHQSDIEFVGCGLCQLSVCLSIQSLCLPTTPMYLSTSVILSFQKVIPNIRSLTSNAQIRMEIKIWIFDVKNQCLKDCVLCCFLFVTSNIYTLINTKNVNNSVSWDKMWIENQHYDYIRSCF